MDAYDWKAASELQDMADALNRQALTVAELFVADVADRDELEAVLRVARAGRKAFVDSVINKEAA